MKRSEQWAKVQTRRGFMRKTTEFLGPKKNGPTGGEKKDPGGVSEQNHTLRNVSGRRKKEEISRGRSSCKRERKEGDRGQRGTRKSSRQRAVKKRCQRRDSYQEKKYHKGKENGTGRK